MPKITQNLDGKWEFAQYPLSARKMEDLQALEWLGCNVPSSIFGCLIEADKIKKTDLDQKPQDFDHVSQAPWIFKKSFDADTKLSKCDKVELVFEGLDTIATIWLNEKLIAKTDNMFIAHRINVTELLKPKDNQLLVKFDPAEEYAKKLMSRYNEFSENDFTSPHRVYIRKAQYQFGTDFCPNLPGCGIWRSVGIEGTYKAALTDVHIKTIGIGPRYADIKISADLDVVSKQKFTCKVTLHHENQTIIHNLDFEPDENSHSTVMRIENPQLWYPTGYGKAYLHQLNVELYDGDKVIDSAQKVFGIKTIKLNLLDEKEADFQFEVNDLPIKVKGANLVPLSIFAGMTQDSDCEKLLKAAADANFNMIRIWGGGYYKCDKFYDICDRLGILVWQDFMFTEGYYPDGQWFAEMIEKEATQVIKKLQNHPSIALWCGNDKIDQMHDEGKLGKSKKFLAKDIYHKLLPKLINDLTDCSYIPSTPLYVKSKNRKKLLTAHVTDVWTGHKPTQEYLCQAVPPFAVEFGLQSLPSIETIKTMCPSQQIRIGSMSLESHNYQPDGNSRLFQYIGELFGSTENLDRFVYLSQVTQARAAKKFVEYLRANRNENNGILFWQFNDCAPAISFSAIDHLQTPKAIYYYAKRFFAGQIATILPELEKNGTSFQLKSMHAIAINDTRQSLAASFNCSLLDLTGNIIDQVTLPITIAPYSASTPIKLPKNFIKPENSEKRCLHLSIKQDQRTIAENIFQYQPDKYMDWIKPEISSKISKISDDQWSITLSSNVIAKDVQIMTDINCEFSDNFIDLIPLEPRTVIIRTLEPDLGAEPSIRLNFVN